MSINRSVRLLFAAMYLACAGCDLSGPSNGSNGGANPGPDPRPGTGNSFATPLLLAVDPDPLQVSAGDVIKLIGVNFQQDLNLDRVSFIAGSQRIAGLPINVSFPTDGNPGNGLESELLVVVPGGVSAGNVELTVDGVSAGARGYDARPQIMAWTLGRNETQSFLVYNSLIGFSSTASFVKLFGLNYNEIEEVQFEDSTGGSARILPNTIERNPAPPPGTPSGLAPTGYSVIGFNLRDTRNDVRLTFTEGKRDNLRVRIKGPNGRLSNTVQIPVHSDPNPRSLGAVINTTKVPTGVVTGPVRINYSMYDVLPDTNYRMEVSWKLVTEEDSFFRPAKPDTTDTESSGNTGVIAGILGEPTGHRLFPGGGAFRTFTWDAPNDPEFLRLLSTRVNGTLPPRYWAVHFLIKPTVEPNNPAGRTIPNTQVITPSILYYALTDRTDDTVAELRAAVFDETFETIENKDTKNSTAIYGPPDAPGAMVGRTTKAKVPQFGDGTDSILLSNVAPEDLPLDAVGQYWEISTDELTIRYKQISSDNGTPCDPLDDELAGGGQGQRLEEFDNPGELEKEFHLAKLEIDSGVQVFVRGANPFVLRLNGLTDQSNEQVFVMGSGSKLDLNGCAGEDGPRPNSGLEVEGRGGKGGPGGGGGGSGSTFTTGLGGILAVVRAQAGEQDGGEGGETPCAVDLDANNSSRFPGAPGGGGGNKTAGRQGDSGAPKPNRFNPPRAGRGGIARGEPRVLIPAGGSGGGGGGATIGVANNNAATNAGAGGGGGGGLMQVIANGRIVVDSTATIEVNGGAGGKTLKPKPNPPIDGAESSAPGGGGSGGSIKIQARGAVEVACESLQAHGGIGGTGKDVKQNLIPGSGDGGDGWIRVESATGGAPTCSPLTAETKLTAEATKTAIQLKVEATTGFPASGTVIVAKAGTGETLEEVPYTSITANTFEGCIRTATSVILPNGSSVFLKGSILPLEQGILFDDTIVTSPDTIATNRGRDGEVHIRYIPSLNPTSGLPLIDPVTGAVLSVWTFDTDTGVITRANGDVLLEVSSADTDPGFLDCTRFAIDPNTILKVVGLHPVRIAVSGQADIAGTIDVSGLPGGLLRFTTETAKDPLPGLGGRGGPGGGSGGDGGQVEFVNGILDDKAPANTQPLHGSPGLAPISTPEGFDKTRVQVGGAGTQDDFVLPPSFTRATGGVTLRGQDCGGPGQSLCVNTAGGGAGGGNLKVGSNGDAIPLPEGLAGVGGSICGLPAQRFGGDILRMGGTGGSGGGGNPHVSGDYQVGILGAYHFKSDAKHAPGTGGGGGGGMLQLVAQNLTLRGTGSIKARGGDAYQSIDLGGNGGGGAGGSVLIQVKNSLTLEPGSVIDVQGGKSNLAVPVIPGQALVEYPGNIRTIAGNTRTLGGNGGNGSPGRVRIEADAGSLAALTGLNTSYSSGPLLIDTVLTIGVSRALRLGVGPGDVATTHAIDLGKAVTRFAEFGQPPGTDAQVLWQGTTESLEQHGGVAAFSVQSGSLGLNGVVDPSTLRGREYVRFVAPFLSNSTTQETQVIQEVRLPYGLDLSTSP